MKWCGMVPPAMVIKWPLLGPRQRWYGREWKPKEGVQVLGVSDHVGMEDLEDDLPTQLSIPSTLDGGEAAHACGIQDVVAANSLSCHSVYLLSVPNILVAVNQPDIGGFDVLSPL